ncbi:MAG: hypothetical protein J5J06_14665 [Phycisphaerae bacterium]|nr:hypothetical protein [Phycisphaerae bacterium]
MIRIPEHIERLISRRLDGELSEAELLELDRELIRNPQARVYFESLRELEEDCAAALHERFDSMPAPGRLHLEPAAASGPPRRTGWLRHRGWLLIPGSIAAAFLAMVIPYPKPAVDAPNSTPHVAELPGATGLPSNGAFPVRGTAPDNGNVMRLADWSRPQIRRNTDRGVIGIRGRDGSLFIIEVDYVRSVKAPPQGVTVAPFETY